jgi:hypothetical protein
MEGEIEEEFPYNGVGPLVVRRAEVFTEVAIGNLLGMRIPGPIVGYWIFG